MKRFLYLFLVALIFVQVEGTVSAETTNTINVANGKVNIVADGQCSLFEALRNADHPTNGLFYSDCTAGTPGGADTINLAAGGSYIFTTRPSIVDTDITINGGGATLTHSDYQFFSTHTSASLTLNNMTIQGSNGPGSAVFSQGSLYINSVVFQDNVRTVGSGAGVDMQFRTAGARAEFHNVTFRNNVASGFGSGLAISMLSNSAVNEVLIDNVDFENNGTDDPTDGVMPLGGGGLYISGNSSYPTLDVRIIYSTFSGNLARAGGAFQVRGNADLTIENTTLDNNTASEDGGGAFLVNEGIVSIENSTISNNRADSGKGGGFMNIGSSVTIRNSTISGNSAQRGGGFNTLVYSGYNVPATTSLEFVTVAQNEATVDGGGFLNEQPDNTSVSKVTSKNSVFFGNTAPTGKILDCLNDGGTITSLGYNMHDHLATSGCSFSATGDDVFTGIFNNHFVNYLALNSGTTMTHRVRNSSLARNRIPLGTNGCTTATRDQRGFSRSSGVGADYCDVGAYENSTGAIPTAVALSNTMTTNESSSQVAFAVLFALMVSTIYMSKQMAKADLFDLRES